MEDSTEKDSKQKQIRDCIIAYDVILTTILLFLGFILIVAGGMSFYNSNKMQYAIILGVGVLITFVASGIYANKGLQWYKSRRERTSEPTFEIFADQIEDIGRDKGLAQSPDLEMNDQHLPSGILRLKDGS